MLEILAQVLVFEQYPIVTFLVYALISTVFVSGLKLLIDMYKEG